MNVLLRPNGSNESRSVWPTSWTSTEETCSPREKDSPSWRILVMKGVAVEHISEVLQAAKKAVRSARDVTEVREILERARASFDAGQYEEAMRQSDRILTLLRPTSADVRGGRVGRAEL